MGDTTTIAASTIAVLLVVSTLSIGPATAQATTPSESVPSLVSDGHGDSYQTDEEGTANRTAAPRLLEKNDDGSRVYVALSGTDEILVIDSETDEVIERISSYGDDPRDLEPVDSDRLLVANWGSGNVALIDTTDGDLLGNFSVGENPWALETTTTNTTGKTAVVASWSGNESANGTITFIILTDIST